MPHSYQDTDLRTRSGDLRNSTRTYTASLSSVVQILPHAETSDVEARKVREASEPPKFSGWYKTLFIASSMEDGGLNDDRWQRNVIN
jgi:hypothetical protein